VSQNRAGSTFGAHRDLLRSSHLRRLASCPRNKHIFRCDQNGTLGKAVRAGLALRGRISESIRNRSGNRRTAAGPFSSQPSGPRPVGCFSVRRPPDSFLTYRLRYARRYCQSGSDRLEKQPTDPASAGRKACLFRGQDTTGTFHSLIAF
jgi:hypothetical protein